LDLLDFPFTDAVIASAVQIKVSALNLPEVVEQRLKELAGLRYDANTGCVRLIADQKLRRVRCFAKIFMVLM
jgi:hypothetical protein